MAIVGVGNCAVVARAGRRVLQGRRPGQPGPRPDARAVRRLPRLATCSSSPRSTSTPRRSASTCPRRSAPARTTPSRSPTCRRPASPCSAAHTLDGLGKYYRETIDESDEEPVDVVAALREAAGRRARLLPAGRLRGRRPKFYAQCAIDAGCAFVNALPVFIAGTPEWAEKFTRRRRPDRRRRHQVAGRRHHHAPGAGQAVRGPRRHPGAHHAAQRRRQHGLHEHARARPAGVQEDLQDPVRHLPGRPRPRRAQRAHRPVATTCRGSTTASGPTSGSRAARSATSR